MYVLTHNLSQVDLSAAWTGQQRFQECVAAGGATQAFWSFGLEKCCREATTGVAFRVVIVAAFRGPLLSYSPNLFTLLTLRGPLAGPGYCAGR